MTDGFGQFWGKTFDETEIDILDAKEFVNEFGIPFEFQSLRPPHQDVIEGFFSQATHSAPSPDGFPYRVWRATHGTGAKALTRVFVA